MTATPRQIWRMLRQKILKSIAGTKGHEFNISLDNVLIIAPHPDDEVLGCGGMIAGLALKGKKVNVLFLTDGAASHANCCTVVESVVGKQRRLLAEVADVFLGIKKNNIVFLGGADGHLPRKNQQGFEEKVEKIAAFMKDKAPVSVFCPHPFEEWADHISASELTMSAIAVLPKEARPRLYYYCVWLWHNLPLKKAFSIDWRRARLLDISEQFPLKQKAMNIYLSPLAPCGNPWVGRLPAEFLRAYNWKKELFFEANVPAVQYQIKSKA